MNENEEILYQLKLLNSSLEKVIENQEKSFDLLRTLYIHGLRTYSRGE